MTLFKAVEAARALILAWDSLPPGDYRVSVIEHWLLNDMKNAISAQRAALPDKSMTESQIEDMFWEMDEQGNYGDRKSPEETIEALKAANVLFVKEE